MDAEQRNTLGRELRTDPDFLELIDDMAEAVRVLLFEGNDSWEDRLTEIISDHLVAMDLEPTEGDNIEAAIPVANAELRFSLRPLVIKVLNEGDWL